MFRSFKKVWEYCESPAAIVGAVFTVAIFLYSTFATSGDVEKVDARVTRSNEFQNVEREKVRQDLKEAVNKLDARIETTNKILTDMLIETRKK